MDAGLFLVTTKLDIYHEVNKGLTKYFLQVFCFRCFRMYYHHEKCFFTMGTYLLPILGYSKAHRIDKSSILLLQRYGATVNHGVVGSSPS